VFDQPLAAVRRVLDGADDALIGVAFVQQRGVNLLEHQLQSIDTGRLITTTVFGSITTQGLETAHKGGLDIRVLNPSRGTFHPKLYLARRGPKITAAIGSANLTSGLVANIEAMAILEGSTDAPELQHLWSLAEAWWNHQDAVSWVPGSVTAATEMLEPALLQEIRATVTINAEVLTLADGKPNWLTDVTADGVWVQTLRSRRLNRPPQLVDAWMIQIAWDYLHAHGSLTNRHLLDRDGLNVKRSSFVCALLARLPDVEVTSTRPIELRVHGQPAQRRCS